MRGSSSLLPVIRLYLPPSTHPNSLLYYWHRVLHPRSPPISLSECRLNTGVRGGAQLESTVSQSAGVGFWPRHRRNKSGLPPTTTPTATDATVTTAWLLELHPLPRPEQSHEASWCGATGGTYHPPTHPLSSELLRTAPPHYLPEGTF